MLYFEAVIAGAVCSGCTDCKDCCCCLCFAVFAAASMILLLRLKSMASWGDLLHFFCSPCHYVMFSLKAQIHCISMFCKNNLWADCVSQGLGQAHISSQVSCLVYLINLTCYNLIEWQTIIFRCVVFPRKDRLLWSILKIFCGLQKMAQGEICCNYSSF